MLLRIFACFFLALILAEAQSSSERSQVLKDAAALLNRQRWTEAAAKLEPLLSVGAPDPVALNLLGIAEMRQGHSDKAENLFQQAIATGHPIVGPHINLAVLYGARRPIDALGELEKALSIDPNNQQAHTLVREVGKHGALDALHSGRNDDALACAGKARDLSPSDPEIQYDLGMVELQLGFYQDAEASLRTALRLRPSYGEAQYALARALLKENRGQDAETEMRTYLKAHPQDATAEYGLGYILVAEQKLPDAKSAFERSLAIQPSQTESLFELGEIALEEADKDTARQEYTKVLAIDPHHSGALTGLGILAFRAAEYEEARRDLEQAIAGSPSYAKAHYYHALLLTKTGDKAGAQREFETAKQLQDKPLTKVSLAQQ